MHNFITTVNSFKYTGLLSKITSNVNLRNMPRVGEITETLF